MRYYIMGIKFTKEQRNVINTCNGPMLVMACPGSGKTLTIIGKIGVIRERYKEAHVLAVSFSKNAAEEMQQRYESYFGEDLYIEWWTLHALARKIAMAIPGYQENKILTDEEKQEYFSQRAKRCDYTNVEVAYLTNNIEKAIYDVKIYGELKIPDEEKSRYERILQQEVEKYIWYKKICQRKDLNDLLYDAIAVLKNEKYLKKWQQKFQFIIVDEAQDMDPFQEQICYMLAQKHRNICLVGDDDQSIYSFRGSGLDVLNKFQEHFPDRKVLDLGKNFRCPQEVVDMSERLIKHNKHRIEKKIESCSGWLEKVTIEYFKNYWEQTDFVVKEIERLKKMGVKDEQIAILYRTNRANEQIVAELYDKGIEFHTSEKIVNYYENVFFLDIAAYWRIAQNKEKKGDWERIINKPQRGWVDDRFGKYTLEQIVLKKDDLDAKSSQTIEKLKSDIIFLKCCRSAKEFIDKLTKKIGYLKWADQYIGEAKSNYIYLGQMLETVLHQARQKKTIDQWIESVYEYHNAINIYRNNQNGITLGTFHSAKGLEWDYVFVINAIEGQTPVFRVLEENDENMIEEERRAFYVAVTRAKKKLYVTGINFKRTKTSRFVYEMQEEQ